MLGNNTLLNLIISSPNSEGIVVHLLVLDDNLIDGFSKYGLRQSLKDLALGNLMIGKQKLYVRE